MQNSFLSGGIPDDVYGRVYETTGLLHNSTNLPESSWPAQIAQAMRVVQYDINAFAMCEVHGHRLRSEIDEIKERGYCGEVTINIAERTDELARRIGDLLDENNPYQFCRAP